MKLQCKAYDALCSLEVFTINEILANESDFGHTEDIDPDKIKESENEYGCGCMKFIPKPATGEVLAKYNITVDEYDEVCNKLESELSFGECYWCA